MRASLTATETRALLARCTRGKPLLVWDGERFLLVTPEALGAALRVAPKTEEK